jgi:hypothetical protein
MVNGRPFVVPERRTIFAARGISNIRPGSMGFLFPLFRVGTGDQTGWALSELAAVRYVPLAHYGSDSIPGKFEGDDPGTWLEIESGGTTPVSAVAG